MLGRLNILCYNSGKGRHVQWSVMNDAALSDFDVIAILEPHLHLDNSNGQPGFGHYSQ